MAATLTELSTLINEGSGFADKIKAACIKTAVSVAFEDPQTANHANRLKWAISSLKDPNGMYLRVLRYVVAANAGLDNAAAILALSDGTIQSHVDASLAVLADGS